MLILAAFFWGGYCVNSPLRNLLVSLLCSILRNNSFSGIIPEEIGELEELEVLDLGYNNFSGPLPYKLGNNLSLAILYVREILKN